MESEWEGVGGVVDGAGGDDEQEVEDGGCSSRGLGCILGNGGAVTVGRTAGVRSSIFTLGNVHDVYDEQELAEERQDERRKRVTRGRSSRRCCACIL